MWNGMMIDLLHHDDRFTSS